MAVGLDTVTGGAVDGPVVMMGVRGAVALNIDAATIAADVNVGRLGPCLDHDIARIGSRHSIAGARTVPILAIAADVVPLRLPKRFPPRCVVT